jgi:hypothetical protein
VENITINNLDPVALSLARGKFTDRNPKIEIGKRWDEPKICLDMALIIAYICRTNQYIST